METVLGGFEELAWEYRDYALAGRHHGFTNVNDTLKELHSGMSKAYPCGAGLGLLASARLEISTCVIASWIPMSDRWDTSTRAASITPLATRF
jgi:hypothetical protein